MIKAFDEALLDTDRTRAREVVDAAIKQGASPEDIVFKVVIPAINRMIKAMSEDLDANLAQNFMTSQIAVEITDAMIEHFKMPPEKIGRVIIGTSSGDLHTLGKRIVIGCLKSQMVDVIDLGTDVKAEKFVQEALVKKAQVIAISSMMMHCAKSQDGCSKVRQLLKEKGLEGKIKVIVGGAPYRYDPNLYKVVGADACADDGITAGKVILDMIKETRL